MDDYEIQKMAQSDSGKLAEALDEAAAEGGVVDLIDEGSEPEEETGPATKLNKGLKIAIGIAGIVMVLIHMINAKQYIMASIQFLNMHLMLAFIVVFLGAAYSAKKMVSKYILIGVAVLSFACTTYIHFDYAGIQNRAWANTNVDLIVGICIMVMGLVGVKLTMGWFMPILITGVCIYPMFGQFLPEPFTTRAYPFAQTISNLCISLTTGMYSNNLRTSAEYIFLFVVFGSMLSASGVQKFFWELGKLLFGKLRSGPGLMAVLNSGLVGSVTGSALANVMITGVYTIPAMKRAGYSPEDAGAMEAAASSGGQIMPPVMGIVAFVMASYTGIPYVHIIKMAVIPALLYYLGVGIYAHFSIMKRPIEDVQTLEAFNEKVNFRILLFKMPGFIIPLALIIILLSNNVSVMEAAFWAILCLCAVSMLVPKDLRPDWKDLVKGLIDGAKEGSSLAMVICSIGMLLVTFSGSGLAVKLASGIVMFSGGTVIGVLLIVWVMCILFGMIGVATIGYYMGAAFAATILINSGLSVAATHFFLMFPNCFAVITPPVAMASLVAAKLAGANYLKCAMATVKAAFMGFVLPFLVVYAPSVILEITPSNPVWWLEIGCAVLLVVTGQLAFTGCFIAKMNIVEQVLLYVSAVSFLLTLMVRAWLPILLLIALVALAAFLVLHIPRASKVRKLDNERVAAMVAASDGE